MSNIIIFSDDQTLLNLLESIASGIQDTNVSKANIDSKVGELIQNASANSILIIAATKDLSRKIIKKLKDSIFGISSIVVSTSDAMESFEIAKEINANALFVGEINNLGIRYAIERLASQVSQDIWKIIDGKKVLFINKYDIQWIKIQGNYSSICHQNKITIVRKPLKQIEEELAAIKLTKIHRSVLINPDYISEIRVSENEVIMRDDEVLPIGRSFKKSISEFIS